MAGRALRQRVGIEKIWAYPGQMALPMTALADARGQTHSYVYDTLLLKERSVNPCWEDPVTLGVNAAKPMLTEEDIASIELLIVGTESSTDQGKPISTFMHRHLNLPSSCRNFETKHACYSGTSGVMAAAHWVASGVAGDAKALVIATDQSRMHLGASWEFVLGTGAVAVLISNKPKVIEFELERNAYWTKEVGDTFRPTSKLEAGNTDNSIYCYLEALEGAYTHFAKKSPDLDFFTDFQSHVYHVPFCGMVLRAHRTQMRRLRSVGRQEFQDHFDQKVARSLSYNTRFGGTYSAATFLALMGTIDHTDHLKGGDRLSIFSYGSGSCSEFYTAIVCPEAKEVVAQANLGQLLDNRKVISVAEYEAVETERTSYIDLPTYTPPLDAVGDLYEKNYAGKNLLIFKSIDGFFREYTWS